MSDWAPTNKLRWFSNGGTKVLQQEHWRLVEQKSIWEGHNPFPAILRGKTNELEYQWVDVPIETE